jgi:hypothetical protein
MVAAAQEVANSRQAQTNYNIICRDWGFSLDELTEDEVSFFFSLVHEFM